MFQLCLSKVFFSAYCFYVFMFQFVVIMIILKLSLIEYLWFICSFYGESQVQALIIQSYVEWNFVYIN